MVGKTLKVSDEAKSVLRRSRIESDRVILPPIQLERKLYDEVNKVLVTAGGWWDKTEKAHLFTKNPVEALSAFLATETLVNEKQEFQVFYTPDWLAALMVEALDLVPADRVLDPSAGEGAIVRACLRKALIVHAVEIRPECEQPLLDLGVSVAIRDFLKTTQMSMPYVFDAAIMNPPFTKGQAINHVMHVARMLKAPMKLAAVMPSGVTFGKQKLQKSFRQWCRSQRGILFELPEDTFSESGTNARAVLLVVDRSTSDPGQNVATLRRVKLQED